MSIDTAEIEKALSALPDIPPQIDSWEVESGLDWTDDPAVWVWALLRDENIDPAVQRSLRHTIRAAVLQRTGNDIAVYIRFRPASEPAWVS